jgi:hypothetical protein
MVGERDQLSLCEDVVVSFSHPGFSSEDYAFRRTLVPHIRAIGQHAVELGMAKTCNDEEYTNFGLVFFETGYWKEAEELQVQVMETRKRVLQAGHPDTLKAMGNLASTFRNQGCWKEAEEIEIQVMETSKRVLGTEHPHTLKAMGNLASTFRNQG